MRKTAIGLVCGAMGMAGAGCGGKTVPLGATGPGGSADGGGSGSSGGGSAGGGAGGAGATGGASGGTAGQGGSAGVIDDPVQEKSSKLDVLLVVDNSMSMQDSQILFMRAAGELVSRLINPRCVDSQGNPGPQQPSEPTESCPAGTTRESAPAGDLHVGLITSSIGGHGADSCSPEDGASYTPRKNDRAHLLAAANTDRASSSAAALIRGVVEQQIMAVGSEGCGFEAPLEAAYRFLADPDPPVDVVR